MTVDSTTHRPVPLPGLPTAVGARAAVSPRGDVGPALLEIDDGGRHRTVALDLCGVDDVPAGVLALPEETFDDLGLATAAGWKLRRRGVTDATRLVLELTTEVTVADAARGITGGGLAGTLLWAGSGRYEPLTVGGSTFEVREVTPRTRGDLLRVTDATTVEIHAPETRSAVDMVILADVSWSMHIGDLNGRRGPQIRRVDGLKQALGGLLEVRQQALGSGSRVALLEFDDDVRHRFPAGGGMAELNGGSPRAVTDAFRGAVGKLDARRNTGTNIQRALRRASEVLYRHGSPCNDRVIVLVSDGADLPKYQAEQTGRVLDELDEPVSLMQHLHRGMRIRLEAVGVSSGDLYRQCYVDEPPGCVPDHRLLQRLVTAGGGGAPTVGGVAEIGGFFRDLGGGVNHPVRGKLRSAPPLRLDAAARQALRRAAGTRRAPDLDFGAFMETYMTARRRTTEHFGESWLLSHLIPELKRLLLQDIATDPSAFRRDVRGQLLRLAPSSLSGAARSHAAVRTWFDRIGALESAAGDLAELTARCDAGSPDPRDVGPAVLRTVQKHLKALADGLGRAPARASAARPPAQRRPEVRVAAAAGPTVTD
jgi:hypothetical protein